jgi:hypothetical protein
VPLRRKALPGAGSAPIDPDEARDERDADAMAERAVGAPGDRGGARTPAGAGAQSPAVANAAGGLVVDDDARTLTAGQMRKSDLLEQIRARACAEADQEMEAAGRSTRGCPFVERMLSGFGSRDARALERAIRRYAPESRDVADAQQYVPVVSARIRAGVVTWVRTGAMPDVPEELRVTALGSGAGVVGALGAVAGAVAGLGRAIRGLFFAEAPGGARAGADAAALHDRLGPGRALDGDVRSRMETAFGARFGSVRIHDDAEAAALSSDLNARAFTVGQHVAFGGGEYRPGNPVGDALLAHELAHTLQQPAVARGAAPARAPEPEVEGEADAAAAEAVGAMWGGAPTERIRKRPRAHGGLRLSRCGGAAAQLARTPRPAAPVPAWQNRPEMEVPLRAAVAALWASPVDVDHNTAANLVAGHPPVYGTDELIPATDSLGRRRQGRCTLPDPERNLVPDASWREVDCSNPGGLTDRGADRNNPIIILNSPALLRRAAEGFEDLQLADLKNTLVHEMNHATNAPREDLDTDVDFGYYKSEFTARWVSPQFRRFTQENERAEAIRDDILNAPGDGYRSIKFDYRHDAAFRRRVDGYRRPDEGMRLSNVWPPPAPRPLP